MSISVGMSSDRHSSLRGASSVSRPSKTDADPHPYWFESVPNATLPGHSNHAVDIHVFVSEYRLSR